MVGGCEVQGYEGHGVDARTVGVVGVWFRVEVEGYAACAVAAEHVGFVGVGEEPGLVRVAV